ncbi:hypothetical protein [Photobacterium leiognathi]|uniref:hypothetical protein n=1 Tax=Photobacterium leiognathi TaxID=553611 RepID=UPI0027384324|nr:hypothetical protein [Photobacterium leiognathi]
MKGNLLAAYDHLQPREDGGRVFTAYLDIVLNCYLIHIDLMKVGATWNDKFSKGKLEGGSVLDSQAKFFGKMDLHRNFTSYVFRYRAIWDKIMGLSVLLQVPDEYDSYHSSKSKKKAFRKRAEKMAVVPAGDIKDFEGLLTEFDKTFRTPEAHGTGSIWKYNFTMESLSDTALVELIGYWNFLLGEIKNLHELVMK